MGARGRGLDDGGSADITGAKRMTDLVFVKGDARHLPLEDGVVQCVVTSPPYWGLRRYSGEQEVVWEPEHVSPAAAVLCSMDGHLIVREDREVEIRTGLGLEELGERYRGGGKKQKEIEKFTVSRGQCARCGVWMGAFGLEPTIEMYVQHTVEVLREVRRVLREDGVVFWNLGDSYTSTKAKDGYSGTGTDLGWKNTQSCEPPPGLKAKDLCLVPQRVAIAAQADGWWVRSMIVWCLSGGTWLYVKSKKGEMPMMVRDMARLDPSTVKLWNGEKWTQALGWNRSARRGDEIELLLRSGERISCTPNHQWPTQRGLVKTSELVCGDILEQTRLPQPEFPRTASAIGKEVAWFLGLYLAEGSHADDTIQISGNADEISRIDRIRKIAESFGGSLTFTLAGNSLNIRVYSRVLNGVIDDHISGRMAHDKGLAVRCWSYSNEWLEFLLSGYLDGDGSLDEPNRRWRIGFTRNYNLERDLRVLSARLGFTLTLNLATATNQDGEFPSFRGEIRWEGSDHRNYKNRAEIMGIRKARCREVYDIGVEDEPHLFTLASGILTHNSKLNPMPESVVDRPTNSYEHIIMLTRSENYFWDGEAVRERVTGNAHERGDGVNPKAKLAGVNSRVYQDRDAKHPSKPKQNPSFSGAISGGVGVVEEHEECVVVC